MPIAYKSVASSSSGSDAERKRHRHFTLFTDDSHRQEEYGAYGVSWWGIILGLGLKEGDECTTRRARTKTFQKPIRSSVLKKRDISIPFFVFTPHVTHALFISSNTRIVDRVKP